MYVPQGFKGFDSVSSPKLLRVEQNARRIREVYIKAMSQYLPNGIKKNHENL
jgi:hypothetical protein